MVAATGGVVEQAAVGAAVRVSPAAVRPGVGAPATVPVAGPTTAPGPGPTGRALSAPSQTGSTTPEQGRRRRRGRTLRLVTGAITLAVLSVAATVATLSLMGWAPEESHEAAPEVPEVVSEAMSTVAGDLYAYDTWRWRGYDLADDVRATMLDDWDPESPVTVDETVLDAVDEHADQWASEPIDPASYRHELKGQRFVETNEGLAYEVDLLRAFRYEGLDSDSAAADSFRLHLDVTGDRAVITRLEWEPEGSWRS